MYGKDISQSDPSKIKAQVESLAIDHFNSATPGQRIAMLERHADTKQQYLVVTACKAILTSQKERAAEMAKLISKIGVHPQDAPAVFEAILKSKGKKKPIIALLLAAISNAGEAATKAIEASSCASMPGFKELLGSLPKTPKKNPVQRKKPVEVVLKPLAADAAKVRAIRDIASELPLEDLQAQEPARGKKTVPAPRKASAPPKAALPSAESEHPTTQAQDPETDKTGSAADIPPSFQNPVEKKTMPARPSPPASNAFPSALLESAGTANAQTGRSNLVPSYELYSLCSSIAECLSDPEAALPLISKLAGHHNSRTVTYLFEWLFQRDIHQEVATEIEKQILSFKDKAITHLERITAQMIGEQKYGAEWPSIARKAKELGNKIRKGAGRQIIDSLTKTSREKIRPPAVPRKNTI